MDCHICDEEIFSGLRKGCMMCGMLLEEDQDNFCCEDCKDKYDQINNLFFDLSFIRLKYSYDLFNHMIKYMPNTTETELLDAYMLFLNTFSSKPRLRILNLLRKKEMNVSEIIKNLKMSQTHVSHNLNRLKSCGFVDDEIKGKYRYYKINKKTIKPVLNLIDEHMNVHCLQIIKKLKGGTKQNEKR